MAPVRAVNFIHGGANLVTEDVSDRVNVLAEYGHEAR